MNIRKYLTTLLFLFLTACSTGPSLISYYIDINVLHFFISPSNWTATGSKFKAQLDITYRTGTDTPAIVNISFFGDKSIPRRITTIYFNGNDIKYFLENITILYPDPKKRELRVSTTGNRDALITLLESDNITLIAEIDGVFYVFNPDKNFNKIKNDFLISVSYNFNEIF